MKKHPGCKHKWENEPDGGGQRCTPSISAMFMTATALAIVAALAIGVF